MVYTASWQKIDVYNFFPVPCIQFEQTVYNVSEGDTEDKPVEVCVVTCSDIGASEIKVHVFADEDVPLPTGAARASKLHCRNVQVCTCTSACACLNTRLLYVMNSTKVQNPQCINELHVYIHWNPASHLIENCEELAQPQRKLEKHAVLYFRERLVPRWATIGTFSNTYCVPSLS